MIVKKGTGKGGLCSQVLFCFSDDSAEEQCVKKLVRKYIRCSSRLTIAHVKKFLKMKLDLKTADQVSDTLVATFDDAILRSCIFHNWFERDFGIYETNLADSETYNQFWKHQKLVKLIFDDS